MPGLVCQSCVRRVTAAVIALDSAARIEADLERQQVRVDTDLDVGVLQEALLDDGYASERAPS
jgi:copper chaperone CopZ